MNVEMIRDVQRMEERDMSIDGVRGIEELRRNLER